MARAGPLPAKALGDVNVQYVWRFLRAREIHATGCNMKLGDLCGQISINYLIFNGSGGGIRTPDTRIMILVHRRFPSV